MTKRINKFTQKNKKTNKKYTVKNKKGGNSNPEIKKQSELREQFRRMFKTLFTIIFEYQDQNEEKYEKGFSDLINGLKRNKISINTLIPVTNGLMPIDKKTYVSSKTPLLGFVPFLSIIIYHLRNENDIIRLLIQFKRNSGNINLMSIKGNITALSTAVSLGKINMIQELIKKGADINMLSEMNQRKLIQLIPDVLSPLEQIPETKTEAEVEPITPVLEESKSSQIIPENKMVNKLIIPFPLPEENGYPEDKIPDFWKPIFDETNHDLFTLREKVLSILKNDNEIKIMKNEVSKTWSICQIVQTMIPSYYVETKKENYLLNGILYNDLDIDFTHYHMLLCACLIIFGIISDRMIGQDYEIIFKGGKAIQLVLAQISGISPYMSEDIDILIKSKNVTNVNTNTNISLNEYNNKNNDSNENEKIKNLASHIGYLIRWFLNSSKLQINLSILLPNLLINPRGNPNIVKISYTKITKKYNFKKGINVDDYRPLADIDFKPLSPQIQSFFDQVFHYSFYIEELGTNVLFVCPYIGSLIDEKLLFYSKYMKYKILLREGKKISDPENENITLNECDFYLKKFSKAIMALSAGLEQKRNPGISSDQLLIKQKKFIMNRLKKINISEELNKEIVDSLLGNPSS